jgi:hypothetical protein
VGWTYSRGRNAFRIFVGNSLSKCLLGQLMGELKDNIKMNLRETVKWE